MDGYVANRVAFMKRTVRSLCSHHRIGHAGPDFSFLNSIETRVGNQSSGGPKNVLEHAAQSHTWSPVTRDWRRRNGLRYLVW